MTYTKSTLDHIYDFITRGMSSFQFTSLDYWKQNERKRFHEIASALTVQKDGNISQLAEKFSRQAKEICELKEQGNLLADAIYPNYQQLILKDKSLSEAEYQSLSDDTKRELILLRIAHAYSELVSHIDQLSLTTANISEPRKELIKSLSKNFDQLIYLAGKFTSYDIINKVIDVNGHGCCDYWSRLLDYHSQLWDLMLIIDHYEIHLNSNSTNSSVELQVSLITLELLCFGTYLAAYMNDFFTDQYSQITEYYFDGNHIDRYNQYYQEALETLHHFDTTITLRGNTIYDKLEKILLRVRGLQYIQFQRKDVEQFVLVNLANLVEYRNLLRNYPKTFSSTIPKKLNDSNLLDFSTSIIATGTEPWIEGATVSYAVYFLLDSSNDNAAHAHKSMISEWTPGYKITDTANPIVKVRLEENTRVILRRFNDRDESVRIVAILRDPNQAKFRDIDRELFEALDLKNAETSLSLVRFYLKMGANVSARLGQNELAIHKAAEHSGHSEVLLELIHTAHAHGVTDFVDAQDALGRTAIFFAAEKGNFEIVRYLIEKHGANPNLQATSRVLYGWSPLHMAIYKDYTSIVELLVKQENIDLNARTVEGFTALHLAVTLWRNKALTLLLSDNRTKVDAKSYFRCARFLPSYEHIYYPVVAKVISLVSTTSGVTPLHMAYVTGRPEHVSLLLQKGADIRMRTNDGSTVMHCAAQNNYVELFQYEDASLNNIPNAYDLTPLFIAYENANYKFAQKLLEHCADVNIRLTNQRTLLHLAVQRDDPYTVRKLIRDGVSVDARDSNGHTALQYSIWYGNREIATELLLGNNMTNDLDLDGDPLIYSVFLPNYQYGEAHKLISLFIKHNLSINAVDMRHKNTLLHVASAFGDADSVRTLLDQSSTTILVDAQNAQHETPLHVALRMGNVECSSALLSKGNASVTQQGITNWTAVNYAIAGKADSAQTRAFAQKFMSITHECNNSANAYRVLAQNVLQAAQYGKFEVNKFYSEQCAFLGPILQNPIHQNNNPIDLKYFSKLASYGDAHALKTLFPLKRQERFGLYDFRQLPVIEALRGCSSYFPNEHCACANTGNADIFNFLHDQGFGLVPDKALRNYFPNSTNWNALNYTILGMGNRTILDLVTDLKVKFKQESLEILYPELRGAHNETLMHLAAQANKVEIAQFLLEKHVDLNIVDREGNSPLHIAAQKGNLEMVTFLIQKGAKVRTQYAHAQTPLIEAILNNGTVEVIEYLLNCCESIAQNDFCPLILAAAQSNKAQILKLLCKNSYLPLYNILNSCVTPNQETALHFAAAHNNMLLAEYFLGSTTYVQTHPLYRSPLYYAVEYGGGLQMVEYLHKQGKEDIENVYEHHAENLIALAIRNRKFTVAKYLISEGADVEKAGKSMRTPLHEAVLVDQYDLIHMLIGKVACANCADSKDSEGSTPLDYIFKYRKDSALQYFLLNNPTNDTTTLMHLRTSKNDPSGIQWIVERGGNVNAQDNTKSTALHLAAEKGYLQVAEELVKSKCIDISIKNENNQTALELAQANNHTDIVDLLKNRVNRRMRRQIETVSMRNDVSTSSSAGRPSSILFNSACVIGSFVSYAYKRITEQTSKLISYTFGNSNVQGNPNAQGIPNSQGIQNPLAIFNTQNITPSIDLKGTLLLLDVLIRKYCTGIRYTNMQNFTRDNRACALQLVHKFQTVLSEQNDFDWFEFYRTVEKLTYTAQYDKIENLLRAKVRKLTFSTNMMHDDEIKITRLVDRLLTETLLFVSGPNSEKNLGSGSQIFSGYEISLIDRNVNSEIVEVNKFDHN